MKDYRLNVFISSLIVLCAIAAPSASALTYYRVEKVQCTNPRILDINDSGQVVGVGWGGAFIWNHGDVVRPFGPLGAAGNRVRAINNTGQVVGQYIPGGWTTTSYFWDPTTGMRGFEDATVEVNSLNNVGLVVGSKDDNAFIWDMRTGMSPPPEDSFGEYSEAKAVNDSGKVVGTSEGEAFLWQEGFGIQYLGTLGGGYSRANDINSLNQVVGESDDYAFLWEADTGMKALTKGAVVTGINDFGQVVGSKMGRAFLWDAVHGKIDLNSLCPTSIVLEKAHAINNSGQIIASGHDSLYLLYDYAYLLTPDPNAPGPFIALDAGEVTVGHRQVRVHFSIPFQKPVVIATLSSKNDVHPCVLRIHDVDDSGFTLQVQNFDYLDSFHGQETVSYMVMEQGSHTLVNGSLVEAGTFTTDATLTSVTRRFNETFNTPPVILTSILTKRGSQAVTGRIDKVTESGFIYHLQEQEASLDDHRHVNETVAYIAWQPGVGTVEGMGYTAAFAQDLVTHQPQIVVYDHSIPGSPLLFVDMQTIRGADTAVPAVTSSTQTGFNVYVQEETSLDSETTHSGEVVGYLTLFQE